MADEYASNKDVNNLGGKVETLKVDFAHFSGRVDTCISDLQKDTELQWEELNDMKDNFHNLSLGIQQMRDDMIAKISTRLGIVVGIATVLIIIAQVVTK